MKEPFISIITPSYQQAEHLEENLLAFQDQQVEHKEQLVADGGSTDGSRKILERHDAQLAWWVCEKDNGQSHAINKALARAAGDVFTWINSDDLLTANALSHVSNAFTEDPHLIVLGGRVIHRSEKGDRVFEALNDPADPDACFIEPVINQPSTYYRTDVVRAIGGVEEKLRYVMDYELWLQVLFAHGTRNMRFIPLELSFFRIHEASKTSTAHASFLDEMAGVLHGLCLRTGNEALADVLHVGHKWPQHMRAIEAAGPEHKLLVKRMVIHFLLKWHGNIHQQRQFNMMKAFRRKCQLTDLEMDPERSLQIARLDAQLSVPNWVLFRIRRKISSFKA